MPTLYGFQLPQYIPIFVVFLSRVITKFSNEKLFLKIDFLKFFSL